MGKAVVIMVCVVAVVMLGELTGEAAAATCNAGQLAVCGPAIISGATPTSLCCSNLKGQQGCFCQYAKNPTYSRYISSPNARNTIKSCGISIPRC